MSTDLFEDLVADALAALPAQFAALLDNVVVVVEDWPDSATLRSVGASSPYALLGFYHGVPQPGRTSHYGMVTPDKISIYRRPIEAQCRTIEELQTLVRRVVFHEIAHHFGIGDDRLREIGAY